MSAPNSAPSKTVSRSSAGHPRSLGRCRLSAVTRRREHDLAGAERFERLLALSRSALRLGRDGRRPASHLLGRQACWAKVPQGWAPDESAWPLEVLRTVQDLPTDSRRALRLGLQVLRHPSRHSVSGCRPFRPQAVGVGDRPAQGAGRVPRAAKCSSGTVCLPALGGAGDWAND